LAEPVSALRRVDRALAVGSWLTAAVLVVMLFAGPAVIANDKASRGAASAGATVYGKGAGADGAKVFQGNCGSCHTLSAAGTSGQVGPNLDNISLSAADIESIVHGGRGAMPSFDGRLSGPEISAVAAFVAASR
jgi:mono/diheme cytochrome c family protein